MEKQLRHLGLFSDIVDEARRQGTIYPIARPGKETQEKVKQALGWNKLPGSAVKVQVERVWERDGLVGEQVSWSVGYGPPTQAWVFKPAAAQGKLPAVLALHDHSGFKYVNKGKIADGPDGTPQFVLNKRAVHYEGQAWVNALAKEGFVVLVHDAFLWGSRRFPIEVIQETLDWIETPESVLREEMEESGTPAEVADYNYMTRHHEHVVAKYLSVLGTNLAGVINYEDRLAMQYLRSRPDVQRDNVACMGLSGGGARAGLLRATAEGLKAAVIVGMMSTYPGLLDHNVRNHSWMFFPDTWPRFGDWPDLVACRAPAPLLVQYDRDDHLFTPEGMAAAHDRLTMHYTDAGAPGSYTGQFFPGPHKFDLEMQEAAFEWLKDQLQVH